MKPEVGSQVWVTGGTHTGKRGKLKKLSPDKAVIAFENGSKGYTQPKFVDISHVEQLHDIDEDNGKTTFKGEETVVDENSEIESEEEDVIDVYSSCDDTRTMSEDDDASIPRYQTEVEKLGNAYAFALGREDTHISEVEETLVHLLDTVRYYRANGSCYY
jgi:hypothetical protein